MSGVTISERIPSARIARFVTRGSSAALSSMSTGAPVVMASLPTPSDADIDRSDSATSAPTAARARSSWRVSSVRNSVAMSAPNTSAAISTMRCRSASALTAVRLACAIWPSACSSRVRRSSSRLVTSVRVRASSSSGRNGFVM